MLLKISTHLTIIGVDFFIVMQFNSLKNNTGRRGEGRGGGVRESEGRGC